MLLCNYFLVGGAYISVLLGNRFLVGGTYISALLGNRFLAGGTYVPLQVAVQAWPAHSVVHCDWAIRQQKKRSFAALFTSDLTDK